MLWYQGSKTQALLLTWHQCGSFIGMCTAHCLETLCTELLLQNMYILNNE